jgi:hypothetical protein
LQDETWTWRTNVSNVAVPDALSYDGSPLVDPTFVYSTYDLQWPGGGTLNEKLNQSGNRDSLGDPAPLCLTAFKLRVRSRYANQYEESDNGNCESVFGAECAAAFLAI